MIRNITFSLALTTALLLTGCGVGPVSTTLVPAPVSIAAGQAKGIVMGGQQPVAGVALQLYAVGVTGYGSAATPLFTPGAVKTTPSGNFTFPSFTCPDANSMIYLVGTGGQPIAAVGSIAAITNTNLALMAGLGTCSNLGGNAFIDMNELTTVASVWALSPFMTGISNIGSPANTGNPLLPSAGLVNAFASINKLVAVSTGTVVASTTTVTLPTAKINTLADILENCVNSAGSSYSGCSGLFSLAGGSATTDTVTAALFIAHNPSLNVASLNQMRSASPVFQPPLAVSSPPNDWSIVLTYKGGGLNAPQAIAADQSGDVWIANSGNSSVSEFSPTGVALSPTAGFTAGGIDSPFALAVDQSGFVWVANSGNNTITKLTSGTAGTAFGSSATLNTPKGIAIDGTGNVWVSNSGGASVSAYTPSGTVIAGSPYQGTGFVQAPVAIAVNPK
ncbi:NHL repeat-containing protein [Granulicella tundricola]|uniref:NHL repeat containing protein n=1 Tax=Granulicella tundricola (strain ATCC BAA-1859 / DSM 23138 / MP5ACTX9) TaxID=1198114 RepID=E8X2J0_GRATM|nr:NHL repeat-containing protein [Granulicella tundricola]ADW69214.1 NHL repeat containing protein [Granulicella tundricola MP5ACTX9]